MTVREAQKVITAIATSDGAGVKLRRSLGSPELPMLDPFLMLDEFYSDDPDDYIAGFPDHPHRGFETVTYMIEGSLEHKDSVGNTGHLVSGSVQWMTAGRGIIHSEMPKQDKGRMWGFQLWVNLPAKLKMTPPRYQDIAPERIPEKEAPGARVRVIAGSFGGARGPVEATSTDATMLDVKLDRGARFEHEVPEAYSAFVYAFEGAARVGAANLARHQLAALGKGDRIVVDAPEGGRVLVLAGRPIREPVARYGPFVMSNPAEIKQAILDFQGGRLTSG
jgi:quercetin 2,3-dioxygenase